MRQFAAVAVGLKPIIALAAPALWVGGAGNWSEPANWDPALVPCNIGPLGFDVTIPPGAGPVLLDTDFCHVDSLDLGTGAMLGLAAGSELETLVSAQLAGTVDSNGGILFAVPATLSGGTSRIVATDGADIEIGAPLITTDGLAYDVTLIDVSGQATFVDLADLATIDARFDDGSTTATTQRISVADGAFVDLSGVTTVLAPIRDEDSLAIDVDGAATIDLSGLAAVAGNGIVAFAVEGGASLDLGLLDDIAPDAAVSLSVGDAASASVGRLDTPGGAVAIAVTGIGATLRADAGLDLPANVTMSAANGARIVTAGGFTYAHSDANALDLSLGQLVVEGAGLQSIEAGGLAAGIDPPSGPNFALSRLTIGSAGGPATVRLSDDRDNGNGHATCGSPGEALYLLGDASGDGLRLDSGSTLILDGIPLFVALGGSLVHVNPMVPPGAPLAWDEGSIEFGDTVDTDGDTVPDVFDNCSMQPNPDQRDTNGDGFGNLCDADLDDSGLVSFGDLAALKAAFVPQPYDPDADLDGDGLVNFGDLARLKALFLLPPGPGCQPP